MPQYDFDGDFLPWFKENSVKFEIVLRETIDAYIEIEKISLVNIFDQVVSVTENFKNKKDIEYSKKGVEIVYASKYTLKRAFKILEFSLNFIYSSRDKKEIDIIDIGSGSGSGFFAFFIALSFLKERKYDLPLINYVCIDSSREMINFSKLFFDKLNDIEGIPSMEITYGCFDWTSDTWHKLVNENSYSALLSSFTFHASDVKTEMENARDAFIKLYKNKNFDSIYLSTSDYKSEIAKSIIKSLEFSENTIKNRLELINEYYSRTISEQRWIWINEIKSQNLVAENESQTRQGLFYQKIYWIDDVDSIAYQIFRS